MKFRICDKQMCLNDSRIFLDIKEAIDALANFHSIDFEDERYESIYEWLNEFETEQEKFEQLIEWGQWRIEYLNRVVKDED